MSRIHFAPEEGRIWLDNQRMLLLHNSALGVLRSELIETMGIDRARGMLTRMGYNSGSNDAELARKLQGSARALETAFVGPQLHMLEGVVLVEPVHMEIDEEKGRFSGEFIWHGSAEAEEHIRLYGVGTDAVCWQQVGYASGFISRYMGRPVLFRETQCIAQGAPHCRIEGRTVEEWEDPGDDLNSLRADLLTAGLTASQHKGTREAAVPPSSLLGDVAVVGVSAGFNAVCHMVRRVATSHATVLFLGESGVGKEVLARSLHRISPRSAGPFVAVNCAAIPETLIEAELFGVEKGAYTGALANRPGRFERAQGGTLFLDEIGILSLTAQGKLLRALQEREIERVGDTRTRRVDVRVIAATNLDLRTEVEQGRFREDLFFRLNVFPIRVPPLRERREDIPVFMNHFLRKFNQRDGRSVAGFTHRAIDAMFSYSWPGNIRELENLVERGVILAPDDGAIDTGHLFSGGEHIASRVLAINADGSIGSKPDPAAGDSAPERLEDRVSGLLPRDAAAGVNLDEIETILIRRAIEQTGGNQAAAARLLGISRAQLIYRMKTRQIDRRPLR
jgi:DNA-binding NtrC family response regulator/predicted hydrocarbon binding protein